MGGRAVARGHNGHRSDVVYGDLRAQIVAGTLVPGERLIEAQIATDMGVSRTPVREALRRLLAERLVSRDGNGALVVHVATFREVEDIYMIREALDGLAARLAAERATAAALARIEAASEAMAVTVERGERGALIAANLAFHDVVYQATGSERLLRTGRELRDFVCLFSSEAFGSLERTSSILDEHRALVDAVLEGCPERAEAAARWHVRGARDHLARVSARRVLDT